MAKAKSRAAASPRSIPIRKERDEENEIPKKAAETDEEILKESGDKDTQNAESVGDEDEQESAEESEPTSKRVNRTSREDVLDEIYQVDADEKKDSVKKISRKANKKSRRLFLIFAILIILAGAALAGFLIFRRGARFSERVNLSARTATTAAAGDEVSIVVSVKNEERIALLKSELTLTPADGFTFRSSDPAASNEFNNAWSLGTLDKSAGTTVTIRGVILGNQDEDKLFKFILTYRPANFNYDFQKTAEVHIRINSSVLKITPEVPLQIIPGGNTDVPVTVENTGVDSLNGIRLVAEYPEAFKFTKATPSPTEKETIWDLPAIPSKGKVKVVISGVITGDVGATPEFKFRVGKAGQTDFQVQAEASGIGTIVKAGMTFTTSVTNPGNGITIGWGETLNYIFAYKNESESEMKDVSIAVEFSQKNSAGQDAKIFDLDGRSGASNGILDGKVLRWTKKEIPALALVKPGTGGDVLLRLPIISGPEIKTPDDRNFVATTTARISVGSIQDVGGKNFENQAAPLETKVTTKLNVEPEGRYYSDEQVPVGTGPLPPQVGKVTTYELSWSLTNPTNEVSQVVVTSTLPDGATWVGNQSVTAGQAVQYNVDTREITWRVNRVPPGTGSLFAGLEAKFQVSVTPASTDVGKMLILLNQTVVTARDEFTSKDLRVEKAIVTSDLTGDVAAQGKGLVVEATP